MKLCQCGKPIELSTDTRCFSCTSRLVREGARASALQRGTTVTTPLGRGSVLWVRMAGPDYNKPEAYGVRLAARADDPKYSGTTFAAKDIEAVS